MKELANTKYLTLNEGAKKMKKISIFFWVSLTIWIITGSNLTARVVCIDPGHGGPGASKYSNGGNGSCASGPSGLSEQWVNLQVALALKDFIGFENFLSPKRVIVFNRGSV